MRHAAETLDCQQLEMIDHDVDDVQTIGGQCGYRPMASRNSGDGERVWSDVKEVSMARGSREPDDLCRSRIVLYTGRWSHCLCRQSASWVLVDNRMTRQPRVIDVVIKSKSWTVNLMTNDWSWLVMMRNHAIYMCQRWLDKGMAHNVVSNDWTRVWRRYVCKMSDRLWTTLWVPTVHS